MSLHWYVAKVEPKREDEVITRYQAQDFTAYFPTCIREKVHKGIVERHRIPLFPSYLFVRFDTKVPGWESVRYTRGVKHILGNSGPSPIREWVVMELQARAERDELVLGNPVRVVGGIYDGVQGLLNYKDRERVRVLFHLLGRQVEKELPLRHVQAI